eukprot:jgi/Picsp_1/1834/NSC_05301-R1_cax-interacting protein 4
MPATVQSRGMLKASTNRVRTSAALQGSAMWENVIGVVNEERGTNARVEAMLNAPQHGHSLGKDRKARREAAAAAMKATGNFDTEITDYESLLSLAKSQGVVGDGEKRGACRICGQLGHLTKQCRNHFSKFYNDGKMNPETGGKAEVSAVPGTVVNRDGLQQAPNWSASSSSDLSDLSDSDSDDEERRSRRKRRKHGSSRRRRSREKSHRSHHRHRDDEHREKKRRKRSRRENDSDGGHRASSEGRSGSRRRDHKSSSRR